MNDRRSEILNTVPEVYSRDEHHISRSDIDSDALKIMYRLIRAGFKAYLVGGGVRDLLLGKKPKDFDITTDATPRRVKALFSNSRIIGRRFKLVHIFFGGGKIIEVSTFRDFSDPVEGDEGEEEVPQLAADNKYGTEVTDAIRRDITINGLFYDLSSFSVIDYVGGIRDLSDRVIRIIGNATVRIKEDPVRMLRVIRHAARAGFAIDRETWDAIGELKGLIASCPTMRIYEELKKDLQSGHFLKILRLLAQSQLLDELLPEVLHDYPALFEERSAATVMLRAIDERFRVGKGPGVSTVLAVLVLVAAPGFGASIREHKCLWDSEDGLNAHIAECFRKLSVPRRERERVEMLLFALFAVLSHDPEIELEALAIDPDLFDDFLLLLEIVGVNERTISLVERVGVSRRRRGRGGSESSRASVRGRPRRRRRGGAGRGGRERSGDNRAGLRKETVE